jgi:hypothetical protein
MRLLRRVLMAVAIAAAAFVSTAGPILAQHRSHTPPPPKRAETHVYLMRGLFGIFSLGMDDLAGKLNQHGYQSNLYGWDSWEQVAALIIERHDRGHRGPIVVIGHSLGANAVFYVSDRLYQRSIPVLLGVTFDATEPGKVPDNVTTFINFWARDGFGQPVEASASYAGELDNFDLSGQSGIDHTSIDALDRFHQFVIVKLGKMTSE